MPEDDQFQLLPLVQSSGGSVLVIFNLQSLHFLGNIPMIRSENQISEIQAWMMGITVRRKTGKERSMKRMGE